MEIQGYENYLIYPDGRVYSKKNDKFLKPKKDNYYRVKLCDKGNQRFLSIHRLVAIHYIPNPDNKPVVDHINRDTKDNRVENLRWATTSENQLNTRIAKDNKSGHKCIFYHSGRKKWRFQKNINKKKKVIFFKTKTDALCFKFIFLLMLKAEIPSAVLPLK